MNHKAAVVTTTSIVRPVPKKLPTTITSSQSIIGTTKKTAPYNNYDKARCNCTPFEHEVPQGDVLVHTWYG